MSRGSPQVSRADFGMTALQKTEVKCPFVHVSLYGKAESDHEDSGFVGTTKHVGTTPMSGNIQQAEYGEGRGILVCCNVVMGVWVTALLCAFQITPLAVGLPAYSIQDHWLQKNENRQEKFISREIPGRSFIYSLKPWGGVLADDAERPLFVMCDVSILPSKSGANLRSTTAHMSMIAESKTGMTRDEIRPFIQFLRVRNLNWMTTS